MTKGTLARIFDPFYTTKLAGRGLGLAAVQGIIRSHGGTVNVVSALGKGSRFEILLPCISKPVPDTGDIVLIASDREPGSVTGTVLVVEDEEGLRLGVSKMLRRQGFSVIEACDGPTGASLFRANESKINVVLLDLALPGMSGREVLDDLRRIRPEVKVILTTAFGRDQAFSAIGRHHVSGYVRKPFQLSELTSLLRKVCLEKSEDSVNRGVS
jgi:two-component system, cell cycle sensor histidine kinase and response regulator CckA